MVFGRIMYRRTQAQASARAFHGSVPVPRPRPQPMSSPWPLPCSCSCWVPACGGRPGARRMPRAAAAGLVLLGLLLAGAIVTLMVVGGIVANSAEITAALHKGADTLSGWAQDLGVGASGASDATNHGSTSP